MYLEWSVLCVKVNLTSASKWSVSPLMGTLMTIEVLSSNSSR